MKVAILAGGFGTRLSEETEARPKPMVMIGGRPILWHIMKHFSAHGHNEFVVLLGYKGYAVKEYFANYLLHQSDVTMDFTKNETVFHQRAGEPWKVSLVDTGLHTMTGGRLKRARAYLGDGPFFLTYGDGVGNVDLKALLEHHRKAGKTVTVTSVQPEGRFGALELDGDRVARFTEKPAGDGAWINGGFFVCEQGVFERLEGDDTVFERGPLEALAADGQLAAYRHRAFWKAMDTLRDKQQLEAMWEKGDAPWKTWT